MALNSVHTNVGALVALSNLNRVNGALDVTQKRVSTGYKVNDAIDDGAAFAVAQNLRSQVASYDAVNQQLGIAQGVLNIAMESARNISDTLIKGKEVLIKLADNNLSAEQRTQYNADLARLQSEVSNFIQNAGFNGVNLIATDATNRSVVATIEGGQFSITAMKLESAISALGAANATSAAAALSSAGVFTSGFNAVGAALNSFGGDYRRIKNQMKFNDALSSQTEASLGNVVDADLAKESARLQALQIRQQLSTQTLGIANQAPQSLLGLFR